MSVQQRRKYDPDFKAIRSSCQRSQVKQ